ncbi:hypothetical protein NA78x_001907 [Anatilimnocola sp. NA78]|uniref:hypothetical protein n=1 Tax=Anatilimnocola sp. NA78 TaxID=3415683 RepID=UPI003CE5A026
MFTLRWQLAGCWLLLCSPAFGLLWAETPRERTERMLDEVTPVMEFVDTPLNGICGWLSEQHGISLKLATLGEEVGHIYPTIPVTFHLRGRSMRSTLNIMLDQRQMDYRVTEEGTILIIAAVPESVSRRPITKRQHDAGWKNFQLLERTIVDLQFVDTPLKDIASYLADEIGAPIVLDPDALNGVQLQPDAPLTIILQRMPLQRALTGLLAPYDLRVALRNEVIYITARDDRMPQREIPYELRRLALCPVTLDCVDAPLTDVLENLAEQLQTTILYDHRRVEASGIRLRPDPNPQTISHRRQRLPLREAFHHILTPLGLRAVVYNELIFITPLAPKRD